MTGHLSSEQFFTRSGVRLRVGILMSASVVLLCLAVVGVTIYWNQVVAEENVRAQWLDDLHTQLAQPETVLATSVTFEPLVRTLLDGGRLTRPDGRVEVVTGTDDATLRNALQKLLTAWHDFVQVQSNAPNVEPERVQAAHRAIHTSLAEAQRQVATRRADGSGMIRGMYATLFLSSLLFLLLGLWLLQQSIVAPVEQLQQIAQRIAAGDLDTPVTLGGQGEFLDLSRSFETMRQELQRSRDRMQRWTHDLEAHVTKRTQQLGALSEVIATASRSLELNTVLSTAIEQALAVIDAKIGAIWLLDESTQQLNLIVSQNLPPALWNQVRVLQMGEGVAGSAAQAGQIIVLEDVTQHPGRIKAVAIQEGIRSIVAIPLRLRERVLGVLAVMMRQPRTFTPEEITLLTSIGQQIGIAVDSLRLLQAVQQQTQQMTALHERERIGIELHDGVLQTLSYLYLQTDQLALLASNVGMTELGEKLHQQRDVIGDLAREIRRFIANLRQPSPSHIVLQTALQEMLDVFRLTYPLRIHCEFDPPDISLDAERCEHIVRIAREALLNAVHHGHAQNAVVRLSQQHAQIELCIQDDGQGFDPDQLSEDARDHFGLSIMQARAVRIGGALTIHSAIGKGTSVCVKFTVG